MTRGFARSRSPTCSPRSVSLATMIGAGANCLPPAVLFLGLAALAYAAIPRAAAGISYGLVAVAFLWQLFGALLGALGAIWLFQRRDLTAS